MSIIKQGTRTAIILIMIIIMMVIINNKKNKQLQINNAVGGGA